MPGSEPDDELLEGVYQGELRSQPLEVLRTDFKPWHKPRKHYVRINQWCREVQKLIKSLGIEAGDVLSYLGLPGEDLLDVHVIKGACPDGVLLRYIGFESKLSTTLNLAQNEINSDKSIDQNSLVMKDRVEDIANPKSVAYEYVAKFAPYDIINLDLCESITHVQGDEIPNLEAIKSLCKLQIEKRGRPWILFLTARALRKDLVGETKRLLFNTVLKNIADHPGFGEKLLSELNISFDQIKKELGDDKTLTDDEWLSVYILSISKWLLQFMMGHGYSISASLLPSYVYGVHGGSVDMISVGFLFEHAIPPRQDLSGLTKPDAETIVVPTEGELAIRILEQVSVIENVDQILEDDEVRQKITEKSVRILKKLRYDMDAYRSFIASDGD